MLQWRATGRMAMTSSSILDGLAAAYRLDLAGPAYLRQLVDAVAPALDRGLGVLGYTYDARDPARPTIEDSVCSARLDPAWLGAFYAGVEAAGLAVGSEPRPTGFHAWRHLACGQASLVPKMRPFLPLFAHLGGARDAFAVNALDASGRGLFIVAPLPAARRASAEQVALFSRFAAHLTATLRIRRNARSSRPRAAAVLSPAGALLDAAGGDERVVEAREDLRRATLALDRARATKRGGDLDLATRRWRPLVVARWSLVDEFDSDGRRFVVAVENSPPTPAPRRDLSEREHQIMTQAHLGHTDKEIAYELGLSASTVRVLLHRAARKLGASTRREALERFDAQTRRAGATPQRR